jgi:hypothetical protein
MRCAAVTTVYAFVDSGSTRGTYTALAVGAEGAETCAPGQYIVLQQNEYENAIASPFRLTVAEGGQLAAAILALWAVAFGFRWIVRALNSDQPSFKLEE